jgi:hypothetical protein
MRDRPSELDGLPIISCQHVRQTGSTCLPHRKRAAGIFRQLSGDGYFCNKNAITGPFSSLRELPPDEFGGSREIRTLKHQESRAFLNSGKLHGGLFLWAEDSKTVEGSIWLWNQTVFGRRPIWTAILKCFRDPRSISYSPSEGPISFSKNTSLRGFTLLSFALSKYTQRHFGNQFVGTNLK